MELQFAGLDPLGRRVHLAFAADFAEIAHLPYPEGAFVVLLGGPTDDLPVDLLYSTAQVLLEKGAAYVLCWGDGASRLEDIVDEAAAMRSLEDPHAPTIMTTAHEGEPLHDVLTFATTVAVPDQFFAGACGDVVMVFHRNVHHYNEAQNCLEELLTDGPG